MRLNVRHIFLACTAAGLITLTAGIAYLIGKGQSDRALGTLAREVDSLRAGQREAAVVKRVSQQMEEIAFQQKAVSDKQRDKAEESSKLALAMRDRAEQESRTAREAESKAMQALNEAKMQRANAEQQQQIALAERDKATLSKTIADTLHIRTQARTLGNNSINRRELGDEEGSDLLAYASWYFLDRYKGNTYYNETFKALSLAVDGTTRYTMQQRGAVQAIAVVPGRAGACVAATNYGELELFTPLKGNGARRHKATVLLQDNKFDFRDAWTDGKAVYALSFSNQLCIVGYQGERHVIDLPPDHYFKMIHTDSNTLLLAGRQLLCYFTISTGQVSAPVRLPKQLSALVKRDAQVCLFYADGSYAEMDGTGKLTPRKPLTPRVVTTAHYAPALECLCLGVKEGSVELLNKYNRTVEYLDAHKAKPQSITTVGSVLISGAYDKAAYIWKLDNLLFNTGLNFWQEMQARTVPATKPATTNDHVPGEWISPVEYLYRGWTLSVCGDEEAQAVWIGTSTGDVIWQDISASDMAQRLHGQLKRNLTPNEWTRYLGAAVPYVQFK